MCRYTQQGFTLAEVLASVFLLALGVVGAAGMQLQALRTAQQSAFQTVALSVATEMADMMRMTLSAPNAHALLRSYLQVDFRSREGSTASTANCYVSSCSPEQLVAFNIEQWKQRIEASLPDARAKICLDVLPSDGSASQPDWSCNSASSPLAADKGRILIKIGWRDKTTPAEAARTFPPLVVLTVAPFAP